MKTVLVIFTLSIFSLGNNFNDVINQMSKGKKEIELCKVARPNSEFHEKIKTIPEVTNLKNNSSHQISANGKKESENLKVNNNSLQTMKKKTCKSGVLTFVSESSNNTYYWEL